MTRCRCKPAAVVAMLILCSTLSPFLMAQETTTAQHVTAQTDSANQTVLPRAIAQVSPERNFGFVIGDVLTQRIALPERFQGMDLSALSDTHRVSTWLERQGATFESLPNGKQQLALRYQVINAPLAIIRIALPELTLTPLSGDPLEVSAWPFSVGPLTTTAPASDTATDTVAMPMIDGNPLKQDMTLVPRDETTPANRLRTALLLFGLTLASWAGWFLWRNHRDKVRLPFAQALQSLDSREQRKHGDMDGQWRALHHAFNQSAGSVINTSTIENLLEIHVWLRPLEPRIREFYAASAARHYALPPRDEPFAVKELARVLADSERRNSG